MPPRKEKVVGDSNLEYRMDPQCQEYLQSLGSHLDVLSDRIATLTTAVKKNQTTLVGITTKVTTMGTIICRLHEGSRAPNEYPDVLGA